MRLKTAVHVLLVLNSIFTLVSIGEAILVTQFIGSMLYYSNFRLFSDQLNADERAGIINAASSAVNVAVIPLLVTNFVWIGATAFFSCSHENSIFNIFNLRPKTANIPTPKITEITLSKRYKFMYENFVVATQHDVFLMLEKHDDVVSFLQFDSPQMKYGSPNDEARGGHPLAKYGLGFYGLFEVENSPWLKEQMMANRVHPKHSDSIFDGRKHYIACFKDVMLEVSCRSFQEKRMSLAEFASFINGELDCLKSDD